MKTFHLVIMLMLIGVTVRSLLNRIADDWRRPDNFVFARIPSRNILQLMSTIVHVFSKNVLSTADISLAYKFKFQLDRNFIFT